MTISQQIITILIVGGITFLLRALPFFIFPAGNKPLPGYIEFLGKVLPPAFISLLLIYCVREVKVLTSPYGIPELISILVVVVLHKWKHNILLSMGAGTILYMAILNHI